MEPLVPAHRRDLRARAHHLRPVVLIGHQGLTPPVLHEIDVALTAHELIKVRLSSDDRREREAVGTRICAELDCAPVQQIGKQLVLWRPRPPLIVTPHAAPGKRQRAPARDRRGTGAASETAPARRRRAATGALPAGDAAAIRRKDTAVATLPSKRRRPGGAGAPPATSALPTRRKGPPSKAPTGVPRAAAPRRRRTAG